LNKSCGDPDIATLHSAAVFLLRRKRHAGLLPRGYYRWWDLPCLKVSPGSIRGEFNQAPKFVFG
jgi:hypothetical protein